MATSLDALSHGTRGLVLAYALVLVSMAWSVRSSKGRPRDFAWLPLVAFAVTAGDALLIGMVFAVLQPLRGVEAALSAAVLITSGWIAGRWMTRAEAASETILRRGAIVSNAPPPPGDSPDAGAPERPTGPAAAGPAADGPDGRSGPTSADAAITVAGIAVARADETKHFKLIGTTGTGKSTAIREIVRVALSRGDRLVIADPDAGYVRRFFVESRDSILNPFDERARKWDLFGEIASEPDVDQLARSLIPDGGETNRIWSEYARTFVSALVQQALTAGIRDDAELYRLLTGAGVQELRLLLAGTAAAPFVEAGNERMFGSIRSVASSAVGALKYTSRQAAPALSVRRWIGQTGAARGGVLFFPYRAGEIAALGSMISAWMRLAIFAAMDLDETDQRLWFVVDELDALGAIDGLKDALARLRKFGGRCVLGFQSIGQVSHTYGRGAAEAIVENCGNTLILRCSASERGGTAEFASRLIGQREVIQSTRSRSRKSTQWLSSVLTTSQQIRIEPAVLAAQIECLPDLQGYLKLASGAQWWPVRLQP